LKFDHVLRGPVNVEKLEFEPGLILSRRCGRCEGERFFAVKVTPFANGDGTKMIPARRAMCEGCKLIVEIQ
jgi:hypothetical protein